MNDNKIERKNYIDSLKGWAILGVIMVHCGLRGQEALHVLLLQDSFLVSCFL